jgi:hypothetical protein
MGFQIVGIQRRLVLVHDLRLGIEDLMRLLVLNSRNGILSPCGSVLYSGTFCTNGEESVP